MFFDFLGKLGKNLIGLDTVETRVRDVEKRSFELRNQLRQTQQKADSLHRLIKNMKYPKGEE